MVVFNWEGKAGSVMKGLRTCRFLHVRLDAAWDSLRVSLRNARQPCAWQLLSAAAQVSGMVERCLVSDQYSWQLS
jgi:hypothetical protein